SPEPKTGEGQQLRLWLDLKWDAIEKDSMVAKGSFRQLARELGYADDGGSQFKTIRESIERLWAVSVIVERGGRRQGFRILSDYASDEHEGKLFVALNPRLAEAVMGERPHTRIDMGEVRALQTDPARLMHQRLCGWIDPGKSGRVELDTLCGYAWPEQANPEAMKKRRQTARKALAELAAVGWTVSEYAKGKWEVKRPAAPTVTLPAPIWQTQTGRGFAGDSQNPSKILQESPLGAAQPAPLRRGLALPQMPGQGRKAEHLSPRLRRPPPGVKGQRGEGWGRFPGLTPQEAFPGASGASPKGNPA
ncbi:replication protein C, IncQ-type, partial [Aeromonas caviae]|uniref:replication protein C, IncQ-type n=2 Tax=Aeromonas caviae TaxID=648 RepID=UPI0035A235F6